MASERPGLSICLAAQASTFSRNSDERRMVVRECGEKRVVCWEILPDGGAALFFSYVFALRAQKCPYFLFFHHLPPTRRSQPRERRRRSPLGSSSGGSRYGTRRRHCPQSGAM